MRNKGFPVSEVAVLGRGCVFRPLFEEVFVVGGGNSGVKQEWGGFARSKIE